MVTSRRITFAPTLRLLLQFCLVSLVPLGALGYILGSQIRGSMERRALLTFAKTSAATSKFVVDSYVKDSAEISWSFDRVTSLTPLIDNMVQLQEKGASVRLVDVFGRVQYSLDPTEIGKLSRTTPERRAAMSGEAGAHWLSSADVPTGDSRKHYYRMVIPIAFGKVRFATLEIVAADHTLRRDIANDLHHAYVSLAAGLFALWLSLVPIVWRVSRRLAQSAATNERMAFHDELTGLPNRSYLLNRGAEIVSRLSSTGLLLIDLDNFKDVNDTLGHGAGDQLLVHVAGELLKHTRPSDIVTRLGGDEFAVLLPGVSEEELLNTAARIEIGLERTKQVAGILVSAQASIGVAIAPDHGTTIEQLVQRADIAMYAAKERAGGPVAYSTDIDVHSPTRLALTAELRSALDDEGQIRLVYQPIVEASTGLIVGAEALARWNNPRRGPISPAEFIVLAERSGLIRGVTTTVLRLAGQQVAEWRRAGVTLPLSVNLSAKNLTEDRFADRVFAIVYASGAVPEDFTIEVTETGLIDEPEQALATAHRLRTAGFGLALDDFGTGFSSLTYLRNLHANILKIDRTFVSSIEVNQTDMRIVRSVIDMAHGLGMVVVAEGVETAEQSALLTRLGCDRLQGYFYSRPLEAEDLMALLNRSLPRVDAAMAMLGAAG